MQTVAPPFFTFLTAGSTLTLVTSPSDLQWFDLAPAWAREMYTALSAQIAAIGSMEGQIMAQVQIDDDTLNNLVSAFQGTSTALESLSQAVEGFIASNPPIPQADLTDLQAALSSGQQALTDGQQAQSDLASLNPQPVQPQPAQAAAPNQSSADAPAQPQQAGQTQQPAQQQPPTNG